ncbi:hypothetical protein LINPERHAP1_LOCUS35542 [Linum perenne]
MQQVSAMESGNKSSGNQAGGSGNQASGNAKSSGTGVTMKAPGADGQISRAEFEKNPSGYFKDLHKK